MKGRDLAKAERAIRTEGMDLAMAKTLAPHKVFPGNRPSLTLAYAKLDPFALGRLIALYEHRIFVEAAILNINAFDQWGVELGKELAGELLPIVMGTQAATGKDASTQGLIGHLLQFGPV
jgi:glucose-6-phosphate isomerase